MYRPKAPQPIRLDQLPAMPSYDDLLTMFQQAEGKRGRLLELTWPGKSSIDGYVLTATVQDQGGEPIWSLKAGLGPRCPIVWTHMTADLSLLVNLIASECTGVDLQDAISQSQASNTASMKLGLPSGSPAEQGEPPSPFLADLKSASATVEGELKDMQPASLLQSITFSNMTGRLSISNDTESVEIFVNEGLPVHATALETRGDQAILELLTWENGKFAFFPGVLTTERTVTARLDTLLMEGLALLDQSRYLAKAGLSTMSYLIRKNPQLTEKEFETKVAQGAPIDLNEQKRFYQRIDSASTLFELLRRAPMPKTRWLPIVFNLVNAELVVLSERPAHGASQTVVKALALDRAAIEGARKQLVRPETGLLSYPLMLYLIEQEHFRFSAGGLPFSVLIFELMLRTTSGIVALPHAAMREVARRIEMTRRPIDSVGHYEALAYCMLLPHSEASAAAIVAHRIVELLRDTSLGNDLDSANLLLAFGVAGMPEDAGELGLLLAGALAAKDRAKQSGTPIMLKRAL